MGEENLNEVRMVTYQEELAEEEADSPQTRAKNARVEALNQEISELESMQHTASALTPKIRGAEDQDLRPEDGNQVLDFDLEKTSIKNARHAGTTPKIVSRRGTEQTK